MKKLLFSIFCVALCATIALAQCPGYNITVHVSADPTEVCLGGSSDITTQISGGLPPYLIQHSNGAQTSTTTVTPLQNTTYQVTVTDANGCTGISGVQVGVKAPITVHVTINADEGCLGASFQLDANVYGATAPLSYIWTNGSTEPWIMVTPGLGHTTYQVTVTDANGCTGISGEDVNVYPIPAKPILQYFELKEGGAMLTANTSVIWTNSFGQIVGGVGDHVFVGQSGIYTGTSKNEFGCVNSDTVVVSEFEPCETVHDTVPVPCNDPLPYANFTATVNDNTVHLNNMSTGATSSVWSLGDGAISYAHSFSYTYVTYGTIFITLTVVNACGDVDTEVLEITLTEPTVLPISDFTFTKSGDCAPVTFQFSDHSLNNPTSWSWTFEGGSPSTSSIQNPVVVFNGGGTHKVTLVVTNQFGSSTKIEYVTVVSSPVVDFTVVPNGLSVSVYADVPGAVHYEYNFGANNATSNHPNANYTYSIGGVYTITLVVTTPCGTFFVSKDVYVECMYMTLTYDYNWGYPGDVFNFHVDAPGNASNVIFTWSVQGGQIVGIDVHNPQIKITMNQSGWVQVVGEKYDEFGQEIVCTQIAWVPIEIFGTTANGEPGVNDDVSVYPNPSSDLFHITLIEGKYEVSLLDMQGKLLDGFSVSGDFEVTADELPAGVYNLQITGEKIHTTKRLVVQR
ncbi:MAG: PKD domain-containing protein [Candidatus Pacebacteria bacterium]|nr:PKD domain-containing protein [Candidatus Paceibacterota bacterium]